MSRWKFCALAAVLLLAATAAGAHMGPGRVQVDLVTIHEENVGYMEMWNTGKKLDDEDLGSKLHIQIDFTDGEPWLIQQMKLYSSPDPVPTTASGAPFFKEFDRIVTFNPPKPSHAVKLDLEDDIGFFWGIRPRTIFVALQIHLVQFDEDGHIINEKDAWAHAGDNAQTFTDEESGETNWGWWFLYDVAHPKSGQFIDAPVKGLSYFTPTHDGITGEPGGFMYFPGEYVDFYIDEFFLGTAMGYDKVSPLDLFIGSDINTPEVVGVARTLQTLDSYASPGAGAGSITIFPEVARCFREIAENTLVTVTVTTEDGTEVEVEKPFNNTLFGNEAAVDAVLGQVVLSEVDGGCNGLNGAELPAEPVTAAEALVNLENGINASGIFRKNISKTEDLGETKQKMDIVQMYFPGLRSDGSPSTCCIDDLATEVDECDPDFCDDPNTTEVELCGDPGVPYEEWRLNGDPLGEECDPRVLPEGTCVVTLIECRDVTKPLVVTYSEGVDIYDDQVTTDFWPGRFAMDTYTAVSRDDGTTWKRMNVSRMADMSSFELETGEPFPGHTHSPYLKVDDNYILVVWNSTFCKSGNPRYSINTCDDPLTPEVETPETGCAVYCRGNAEQGTEVCEPDYPYDDEYAVTDIWGVRGQQQSVDYDLVDDVADLGIGEIPYSCLWAARGVIVSAKELADETFASMTIIDDNNTPDDTADDVTRAVELGDIVWFKPERITSGRRDAYISVVGSARGAGFAIAWQEDPEGLRPGKGKGPGQGWSGAISNHKTDIWYTFLSHDDFAKVDANFVAGGPPDDGGPEDKPGLGRPKYLVPFSLPVRVSDNDMINTHTLKVEPSGQCVTPPGGTEEICFPEVVDGSFVPLDEEEIAVQFCDHPEANPLTCCDPDYHETDSNCEDLKGLYGNLTGTKRYAYLARTLDDNGDGVPDYQYYMDRGGTLDLCDVSGANSYMDMMPGGAHERWFGFTNAALSSKLVCVSSDGRLMDGDVSASRPNIQMQPYTKGDGTKSAWVLLGYEESKGMGHSLAAAEHDDAVDPLVGEATDESGQEKPIKQDLGKNVIYHSFDFTQPDLVSPGHIINLPALCGGLYPTYCDDPKTPDVVETNEDNPTCTCEPGQPVPLYFDYQQCSDPNDPATCEWIPDETKFLQYRYEIARRVRFIMQSGSKAKVAPHKTLGAIIYKQGQEGQGRPADVFIRRLALPEVINYKTDNPFAFENYTCNAYLDETFALPACPNGAGDKPSAVGYNCNVWGEASGDRLCGGIFTDPTGGYTRRDHVNLTSANIDYAVDAGPVDDTPDDPTDDRYGTNKVLLWSQSPANLGDESYGLVHEDGTGCDHLNGEVCPGMYSNARSHRGFVRGDFLATAYSMSPNWAAGRNGRDRYNFYIRKSFDGGQTWTTTPTDWGGAGIHYCREYRTDPVSHEAPLYDGFDENCMAWCSIADDPDCEVTGDFVDAGQFEQAIKVSQFDNNKETSSDPRIGATPPVFPLDGRDATLPELKFHEDEYVDNIFFVAWGAGDNLKSIGSTTVTPEAPPTDVYYTRTMDYGDHFLKIPWVIGGDNSLQGVGETVWRYDFLAKGDEEEQGECQLRATSDGTKMYAIYYETIPAPEDPDVDLTRWYPWEVSESSDSDIFFRRIIFWPDEVLLP